MTISENTSDGIDNSINANNAKFDFGPRLPDLDYIFNKKEIGQIFAHRKELTKFFKNIDKINILLWLGFGITDKDFEYLCAYFAEREYGYKTDVRGGYLDQGIDVSGILGTKDDPEFIAIQCKQWNSWKINERGISEMFGKMARAKDKCSNIKLVVATINYLDCNAWDFAEANNIIVWDYVTIFEFYKKYFFDPNESWQEFQDFISRKKAEKLVIKQKKEKEEVELITTKIGIGIQRESISQRFEVLKIIRKSEAKKYSISPNYVFSDAVLNDMIKYRPQTKLEFLKISGIGEEKYKKHCNSFAKAISEFKD